MDQQLLSDLNADLLEIRRIVFRLSEESFDLAMVVFEHRQRIVCHLLLLPVPVPLFGIVPFGFVSLGLQLFVALDPAPVPVFDVPVPFVPLVPAPMLELGLPFPVCVLVELLDVLPVPVLVPVPMLVPVLLCVHGVVVVPVFIVPLGVEPLDVAPFAVPVF